MPAGCLSFTNLLIRSYRKGPKSIPTSETIKLSVLLTFTSSPEDSFPSRPIQIIPAFSAHDRKSVAKMVVTTVLKGYIAPAYHRTTCQPLISNDPEFQRTESVPATFSLAAIERKLSKSLASVLRLLETPGYLKEFHFTIFYK